MKEKLTELVFILDKSGSMSGLENDTIGGFNSVLEKQKNVEGKCNITTALFDSGYELIHEREDIKNVKPITREEYFVGGSTALLDALVRTITSIERNQEQLPELEKADDIIFVIITDGEENSSLEYSLEKIKNLIERKKAESKWEFVFMGANIDAIKTAGDFGINADRATNFVADGDGISINYRSINNLIENYRTYSEISEDWDAEIREDYEKRQGKKK